MKKGALVELFEEHGKDVRQRAIRLWNEWMFGDEETKARAEKEMGIDGDKERGT
jgi:hypothetical protein